MKAFQWQGGRELIEVNIPKPSPQPGELLIAPTYVGLCMSEKHWLMGAHSEPKKHGKVWGHEWIGKVVEVGRGGSEFVVGDRVAVNPILDACGQCLMCRGGLPMHCPQKGHYGVQRDGALAEFCVAPHHAVYRLPDDVSDLDAGFIEAAAQATRAVRLSSLSLGDNVVVLGLRDYTLCAIQCAKAAGAHEIIAVDPIKLRRDAAVRMGATMALDPWSADVPTAVRERIPHGADMAFVDIEEYMPISHSYIDMASELLRPQGEMAMMSIYRGTAYEASNTMRIWFKEITIKHYGAFYGEEPIPGGRDRGDYQRTIDMFRQGQITSATFEPLIVDLLSLSSSDILAVYDSLPEAATKVLFRVASE